jgi:hypothetical protein
MKSLTCLLALLVALALTAVPAAAQSKDCGSLPTSAQKSHTCNPQQECVAKVENKLKGPALDAARKDCQRLPSSGTCYGPDTYNPQAECRERTTKK